MTFAAGGTLPSGHVRLHEGGTWPKQPASAPVSEQPSSSAVAVSWVWNRPNTWPSSWAVVSPGTYSAFEVVTMAECSPSEGHVAMPP